MKRLNRNLWAIFMLLCAALPGYAAAQAPDSAQGRVEVTFLEAFHKNGRIAGSRYEYRLIRKDGSAVELSLEQLQELYKFKPGAGAAIEQGHVQPQDAAVVERQTTGDQSVAYILAYFDGQNERLTNTQKLTEAASGAREIWAANSRGNLRLNPTVFVDGVDKTGDPRNRGWLHIDGAPTCNFIELQTRADAAARAAGIPLDNYPHRVYYLPQNLDCKLDGNLVLGGTGSMGKLPSYVWINGGANPQGNIDPGLLAHEQGGHAVLWLDHPVLVDCPNAQPSVASGQCGFTEYRPPYGVMSDFRYSLDISPQERQELWGIQPVSIDVAAIQNPFQLTHDIVPADLEKGGLRVQSGSDEFYLYTSREPRVTDSTVNRGVLIAMKGEPYVPGKPFHKTPVLNMNPNSPPQTPNIKGKNAGLERGKAWTLPGGQYMISVAAADETKSTVYVGPTNIAPPTASATLVSRTKKTASVNGSVRNDAGVARAELWVTIGDQPTQKLPITDFVPTNGGDISIQVIKLGKKDEATVQLVAYDVLNNVGFSDPLPVGKYKKSSASQQVAKNGKTKPDSNSLRATIRRDPKTGLLVAALSSGF